MKIIAMVPCRAGSERVPEKNTRPFAGLHGGLLEYKLLQLLAVGDLEIIVTTDDPIARTCCMRMGVRCVWQPPEPSQSTDALITYVPKLFQDEFDDTVILWTHVTSPFFGVGDYRAVIARYKDEVGPNRHYDSLMTARRIQDFLWDKDGPINYTRGSGGRWPRTQDVEPRWQITGAAFMAPLGIYRDRHDRIGDTPLIVEVDPFPAVEIDRPEDFMFAEALVEEGIMVAGALL